MGTHLASARSRWIVASIAIIAGGALLFACLAPSGELPPATDGAVATSAIRPEAPKPSPTPTPLSPAPAPTAKPLASEFQQIRAGILFPVAARWLPDADRILILPANEESQPMPLWVQYDPVTERFDDVGQLIDYDPLVWFRLGLPEGWAESYQKNAESRGNVSPSGGLLLYMTRVGEDPWASPTRREVWLAATDGRFERRVLTTDSLAYEWQIEWNEEQREVVFGVCHFEGVGCELYRTSTDTGSTTSVTEMVNARIGSEPRQWAVSSDGITLAFDTDDCRVFIMPIQGGEPTRVDTLAMTPTWSPDGTSLYYWVIEESACRGEIAAGTPESTTIRRYRLSDGARSTVLRKSDLPEQFREELFFLEGLKYSVSTSGRLIAFWEGGLWIATLGDRPLPTVASP